MEDDLKSEIDAIRKHPVINALGDLIREGKLSGDGYNDLVRRLTKSTGDDAVANEWTAAISQNVRGGTTYIRMPSVESLFRYLEYLELRHSAEQAAKATRQARNAFWISAASLVLATVVGVAQIFVPMFTR